MTTDPIKQYWPQFTAIAIVIFWAAISFSTIQANETAIAANTAKIEKEENTLDQVNEKVARIETKQETIQEDVDEIKGDIKTILKELREAE